MSSVDSFFPVGTCVSWFVLVSTIRSLRLSSTLVPPHRCLSKDGASSRSLLAGNRELSRLGVELFLSYTLPSTALPVSVARPRIFRDLWRNSNSGPACEVYMHLSEFMR